MALKAERDASPAPMRRYLQWSGNFGMTGSTTVTSPGINHENMEIRMLS